MKEVFYNQKEELKKWFVCLKFKNLVGDFKINEQELN